MSLRMSVRMSVVTIQFIQEASSSPRGKLRAGSEHAIRNREKQYIDRYREYSG